MYGVDPEAGEAGEAAGEEAAEGAGIPARQQTPWSAIPCAGQKPLLWAQSRSQAANHPSK
jgi:hypothetical protein